MPALGTISSTRLTTLCAIPRKFGGAGLLWAALMACGVGCAGDEAGLATQSMFDFERGQLVAHSTIAFEESLPPPPEPLSDANTPFYAPWPPGANFGKAAAAKLPQYLPEGLVPPVTGPTGEAHRAYDVGQPLKGTSWLAAHHSAGMFLGPIAGATLINDQLDQGIGGLFGLRFGYDYDHRWGLEKRFGFAQMNVFDIVHHQRQIINLELGDVDLLFYPWGDTCWRPYISAGAGLAHFGYQSETGDRIDRLLIGLPFGIGLKYFWSEGVAVRVEMVDNLMLGTHELGSMNNVSLATGIEFRYSGFHLGKS